MAMNAVELDSITTLLEQHRSRSDEVGIDHVGVLAYVLRSYNLRWDDSGGGGVSLIFVCSLLYPSRCSASVTSGGRVECEVICTSL